MRALAYFCFALSAILGAGAVVYLQRPSWSPIASVLGALALPGIFAWWGVICWRRYDARPHSGDRANSFVRAFSFRWTGSHTAIASLILILGIIGFIWLSQDNSVSLPSKINSDAKLADRNAVKPIEVASTCPDTARLRTIAEIRSAAPQDSGYSDLELAEALIKLCYPSELPSQLAERLIDFNATGKSR